MLTNPAKKKLYFFSYGIDSIQLLYPMIYFCFVTMQYTESNEMRLLIQYIYEYMHSTGVCFGRASPSISLSPTFQGRQENDRVPHRFESTTKRQGSCFFCELLILEIEKSYVPKKEERERERERKRDCV